MWGGHRLCEYGGEVRGGPVVTELVYRYVQGDEYGGHGHAPEAGTDMGVCTGQLQGGRCPGWLLPSPLPQWALPPSFPHPASPA